MDDLNLKIKIRHHNICILQLFQSNTHNNNNGRNYHFLHSTNIGLVKLKGRQSKISMFVLMDYFKSMHRQSADTLFYYICTITQ